QIVRRVNHAAIANVEGRASVIGSRLERIGDESRGIGGYAGVHVVAVIERLGESVGAAELQSVSQPAIHVHLEAVIRTDAFGKPVRGVPDGLVSQRRVGVEIEGARRVAGGAGRSRADRGNRKIRIQGKQFVVAVRTDIAQAHHSVRRDLLLNFQRVGFHRGRLQVWLHAAGN